MFVYLCGRPAASEFVNNPELNRHILFVLLLPGAGIGGPSSPPWCVSSKTCQMEKSSSFMKWALAPVRKSRLNLMNVAVRDPSWDSQYLLDLVLSFWSPMVLGWALFVDRLDSGVDEDGERGYHFCQVK